MKKCFLLACALVASLACHAPGPHGPDGGFPNKPPPGGEWPFGPVFQFPRPKDNLLDAKPVILPPQTVVVPVVGELGQSSEDSDSLTINISVLRVHPKSSDGSLVVVDKNGKEARIEAGKPWEIRIKYQKGSGGWDVSKADLHDPMGNPQTFSFATRKGTFPGLSTYGVYDDPFTGQTWVYGYLHECRTDIQIRGLE